MVAEAPPPRLAWPGYVAPGFEPVREAFLENFRARRRASRIPFSPAARNASIAASGEVTRLRTTPR